jgi:hypothetical protein
MKLGMTGFREFLSQEPLLFCSMEFLANAFTASRGLGRVSTKPSRQSIEGYAQGSDLSVDRCTSFLSTQDTTRFLSRFGRREGVIPMSCI